MVLQGGGVPLAARLLRIPMHEAEPLEPYATGLRFRTAPQGLYRYTVGAGSAADGAAVGDLALGEETWLSLLRREGRAGAAPPRHPPARRATRCSPRATSGADLEQLFHQPGAEWGPDQDVQERPFAAPAGPLQLGELRGEVVEARATPATARPCARP